MLNAEIRMDIKMKISDLELESESKLKVEFLWSKVASEYTMKPINFESD